MHSAKGIFPVALRDCGKVTDAFLRIKGAHNTRVMDTFRRLRPGFGFIPILFKRFAGCHTLYLMEEHFKLVKHTGGGDNPNASKRQIFSSTEYLAGKLDTLKWVSTTKQGKNLFPFVKQVLSCWIRIAFLSLFVAMISPKCMHTDMCSDHRVLDTGFNMTQQLCDPDCASLCNATLCGGSGLPCDSTDDGICDVPLKCRAGTDTKDCEPCSALPENATCVNASTAGLATVCPWHDNGVCDEPERCRPGSDTHDCEVIQFIEQETSSLNFFTSIERETEYSADIGGRQGKWMVALILAGDDSCQLATVLDKCSGCSGHAGCSPLNGTTGFPDKQKICQAVETAHAWPITPFCRGGDFNDMSTPCKCLTPLEQLKPDMAMFWSVRLQLILFAAMLLPCAAVSRIALLVITVRAPRGGAPLILL